MNKIEKYRIVFELAKSFLDKIVEDSPALNQDILQRHLCPDELFADINSARKRLIQSLSNRNMMASVIGFVKREKAFQSILFGYDPEKILSAYPTADVLISKFKSELNLENIEGKRSLWRKFAEGIISGSRFMLSFKDKSEFDRFIKNFSFNKYTKAALPMLLSREVDGFGFALACDFLKELGYREYPKPDVHLIEIFYNLGLSDSKDQYDVYKSIVEMSEATGVDAYTIDKIFWLIGSGRFYLVGAETGRNREKFVLFVKHWTNKVE